MSTRPKIVLVHGAFANAGCWAKLVPLLRAKGLSVVASNCPLGSLKDDVDAVRRTIKMQDGPVLLVGHSWGGAIITEAGNEPQVRGLLYIAAAAPDSAQSFNEWWKGYPAAPGAPASTWPIQVACAPPVSRSAFSMRVRAGAGTVKHSS